MCLDLIESLQQRPLIGATPPLRLVSFAGPQGKPERVDVFASSSAGLSLQKQASEPSLSFFRIFHSMEDGPSSCSPCGRDVALQGWVCGSRHAAARGHVKCLAKMSGFPVSLVLTGVLCRGVPDSWSSKADGRRRAPEPSHGLSSLGTSNEAGAGNDAGSARSQPTWPWARTGLRMATWLDGPKSDNKTAMETPLCLQVPALGPHGRMGFHKDEIQLGQSAGLDIHCVGFRAW